MGVRGCSGMNIEGQLTVSSVTFRDASLERAVEWLAAGEFRLLDVTAIRHYCDHFDPLLVGVDDFECVRVRDTVARAGFHAVSVTGYPANPLAHDLNGDDWVDGVDAYVQLALHLQNEFHLVAGAAAKVFDGANELRIFLRCRRYRISADARSSGRLPNSELRLSSFVLRHFRVQQLPQRFRVDQFAERLMNRLQMNLARGIVYAWHTAPAQRSTETRVRLARVITHLAKIPKDVTLIRA